MKTFDLGKYAFRLLLCFSAAIISVEAGTILDFDGDGRTDPAIVQYQAAQAGGAMTWIISQSSGGLSTTHWGRFVPGGPVDGLVAADYDGDGKTDIAVARRIVGTDPINWYILNSSTNTMTALHWGALGDLTLPQDYDGDGKADPTVYRNGWWYILQSSNGQMHAEKFGHGNLIPFAGGDYDGDGKDDLVVFGGALVIRRSSDGNWEQQPTGDHTSTGVLAGDYDGDGRADVAIWRGNLWLWVRSSDNKLEGVRFGSVNIDKPVPGDYDGDGKTDPAVYRENGLDAGHFYILGSRDGFRAIKLGVGDSYSVMTNRYIPASGF